MNSITRSLAAAAALAALSAPAQAGTLAVSRSLDLLGNPIAVDIGLLDATSFASKGGFTLPGAVDGLAYGQGRLFVSSAAAGTVTAYNLSGAQLAQSNWDSSVTLKDLAFEGGDLHIGDQVSLGIGGTFPSVLSRTPDLTYLANGFDTDLLESGLAAGGGDVFVSQGAKIQRFGSNGVLDGQFDLGPLGEAGALAYGDGKLFAAYLLSNGAITSFHVGLFDAQTLNPLGGFALDKLPGSLAFGDGALFASFGDGLARYDQTGAQTGYLAADQFADGKLAFIPDAAGGPIGGCRDVRACGPGGGVPEPSAWALVILGLACAGAALRSTRKALPAR